MRHRARVTTVVLLCAWLGLGAAYATATEPTDTDTSTDTTLDGQDGDPVPGTTEDPDEIVDAADDTVEEAEGAVEDAADSLDDTAQDPQQAVDDATSEDPGDESTKAPSEPGKDEQGQQDGGGEDDPGAQDDEGAQDDAEEDTADDGSQGSRRPRPHPDPPEFVFGERRASGGGDGALDALRFGSSLALGSPISAGPRSTAELFARPDLALVAPSVLQGLLAPFPVFGPASYQADFGAPRAVPTPHAHQGTDVFAQRGTPVIAAVDGIISRVRHDSAIGGNSLRLTGRDGSFFYYAHLDRFADDLHDGRGVEAGQVLGFVGDTGNAAGTPPHLHFEIHPHGGDAVDPVPYLDRWLAEARAAIDRHLGAQQVAAPEVAPPSAPAPESPAIAAVPSQPDEPPPVLAAPAGSEMEAMLEARAQHERVALGAFVSSLLALAIALRLRRPAALARVISRPQAASDRGRATAVRSGPDRGGSS